MIENPSFYLFQMAEKLTKAQREQIIFAHLKGQDNPLYEVTQTKYGKYVVKAKPIEVEEEETINEPEEEEEPKPNLEPVKPINDRKSARRERRKRNRHAKQNAKRILDALTNLINSNNDDESSDDEERPQAPQLIEQPNFNPQKLSFHRRRLAF